MLVVLSAAGELDLPAIMPTGVSSAQLTIQGVIGDPVASGGIGLSNAITAITAP